MLTRISSHELSEWMVYERENGPIGTRWQDEMLAQIHEVLQYTNHLLGAQLVAGTKPQQKNPAPEPTPVPRPWLPESQPKAKE